MNATAAFEAFNASTPQTTTVKFVALNGRTYTGTVERMFNSQSGGYVRVRRRQFFVKPEQVISVN